MCTRGALERLSPLFQHLRKMKEAEAEVRDAEKHLNTLLEKEKRMEKELHRLQHPGFFSRSKPGDTMVIRHHLREVDI